MAVINLNLFLSINALFLIYWAVRPSFHYIFMKLVIFKQLLGQSLVLFALFKWYLSTVYPLKNQFQLK